MSITFPLAYGIVYPVTTYSNDIGAPPDGAKMLVVFGASNGKSVPGEGNPPPAVGVTFGGVAVPAIALGPSNRDFQMRTYLLQDLTGAADTLLVFPAVADKQWGALWVVSDAEIEYFDVKSAGWSVPATTTHDPAAHAAYGACGGFQRKNYSYSGGVWPTLGGSPTVPTKIGASTYIDVNQNNRTALAMAAVEDQTGSGAFTLSSTGGGSDALTTVAFGVLAASRKRNQAIVVM